MVKGHFRHARGCASCIARRHARPCSTRHDSSDSCNRFPSHILSSPGESWCRSEPDALHWLGPACRGTETCIPSEDRNRLSPSHWWQRRCHPRAWRRRGQRSSRLWSLHRRPLAGLRGHVTLYGDRRASSRDAARMHARSCPPVWCLSGRRTRAQARGWSPPGASHCT